MKWGLAPEKIAVISKVFEAFPQIQEVVLYGSRALGTFKPGSDIDFTLKGEDLDLHTLHQIATRLDDLLLPYTFDLSVYSQINSAELLDHIQRVGQRFYPLPR